MPLTAAPGPGIPDELLQLGLVTGLLLECSQDLLQLLPQPTLQTGCSNTLLRGTLSQAEMAHRRAPCVRSPCAEVHPLLTFPATPCFHVQS